MKTLRLLLVFAATCLFGLAASAPTVVEGPVVPWRIQVDLKFADGAVVAAVPEVFYQQEITVGGTLLVKDHGKVSWDSVAKSAEPVTITLADGTALTTTRGAVLAAVIAIAAEERAAQAPGP